MEKWLFLCSSPYTVFNAINLAQREKNECCADIIIFEKSPVLKQYAQKLKKMDDFNGDILLVFEDMFNRIKIKLKELKENCNDKKDFLDEFTIFEKEIIKKE